MPPEDAAAQGAPGGRGGDRLSGLRDETLVRVMSHLKAWEAVRTCVLSRRWRDLWASATRLDIRHPCGCPGRAAGGLLQPEEFAVFVENLLARRGPLAPLDSLRLCWSHETDHGDANTWVAHAVRHGAVEIELSGKHHEVYPSPEYKSFIAGYSDTVKIRLKILRLIHVRLDDTTLTQLCSRCACLEELELKDCLIPQKTKIQPNLLERLTVTWCEIPKGLSVYAPNLGSVQLSRNIGYGPWIQLAASNIQQWAPHDYPECSCLGSCNLKIFKLSCVELDDTSLAQLCSGCASLEDLELKECSVAGKVIRCTSLKCLAMINCKFVTESVVYVPNILSLCCIRPFRHVPQFWNMEFLVTAIIQLDDSCMLSDSQWPCGEDEDDESDHDGDFFAHSDGNSDNGSYQDEEDECDLDGAHSTAEESGSDNYHGCSPCDEVEDRTVDYDEIAEEYSADSGGMFGGDGILCSLSNVRTMDLSAHSGEVLFMRESKSCTDFKNLKTLSIGEWYITPDLDVLASMLQRAPNLENLFVHLDMANNCRVGFNPRASSFACTNLKKAEITCCKHDKMVHVLAEFFRVNSIACENIFVHQTACTCDVNRDTCFQAKHKAQTEAEKRPEIRKLRKTPADELKLMRSLNH